MDYYGFNRHTLEEKVSDLSVRNQVLSIKSAYLFTCQMKIVVYRHKLLFMCLFGRISVKVKNQLLNEFLFVTIFECKWKNIRLVTFDLQPV